MAKDQQQQPLPPAGADAGAAGAAAAAAEEGEEGAAAVVQKVEMAVVQTAYANGGSTSYLRQLKSNVRMDFAKTGVKFVHHVAEKYDIGVYFEVGYGDKNLQECRSLFL
jgi:phosphoacetylglucosamine mutase